jgi:hypothetical protein
MQALYRIIESMVFAMNYYRKIMLTASAFESVSKFKIEKDPLAVDISAIANPTLARLLAEVKNDEGTTVGAYDRAHNRHNR